MKICGRCKEKKSFDNFGKKGKGYQSYCITCRRIKQKEWVESNPERIQKRRDRAKQWAKDNPEKKKKHSLDWKKRNIKSVTEKNFAYHIEKTYGLSVDQYNKILNNQNSVCAICKKNKKLWIDHNHSTGAVRGLLCPSCNSLIGYLETYENLLPIAIEYLSNPV